MILKKTYTKTKKEGLGSIHIIAHLVVDYIDDYIFDEYLLVSEDGANLLSRNTPALFLQQVKYG